MIKVRTVGIAIYHERIAIAGPTNRKGCNLDTHWGGSFSINQFVTKYIKATPPTPQMIATRAIMDFGAAPSLRNIKPLIITNPVITGTETATRICPTEVVNHSRIVLNENLDWVASAMRISLLKES